MNPGTEPDLQIVVSNEILAIEEQRLRTLIEIVLADQSKQYAYIGIILTDRSTVHTLNRDYLQHDYPTDVLSFSLSDDLHDSPVEGEVYVDLSMAIERAPEFDTEPELEAVRYAIHGILHLCGFDDGTDAQRDEMRRLEDYYLGKY